MVDRAIIDRIASGDIQVAKGLAAAGESFNRDDAALFQVAAENNRVPIMDVMYEAGLDLHFLGAKMTPGSKALWGAVNNNHPETVRWLLSKGISAYHALQLEDFGLVQFGHRECLDLLLCDALRTDRHMLPWKFANSSHALERLGKRADTDFAQALISHGIIESSNEEVQVALASSAARAGSPGYADGFLRKYPEIKRNPRAIGCSLRILADTHQTKDFLAFFNLGQTTKALNIDIARICLTTSLLTGNSEISQHLIEFSALADWRPSYGLLRSMIKKSGTENTMKLVVNYGLAHHCLVQLAESAISQSSERHLSIILGSPKLDATNPHLMNLALAGTNGRIVDLLHQRGARIPFNLDLNQLSPDVRRSVAANALNERSSGGARRRQACTKTL